MAQKEMAEMAGTYRLRVPELLKARGADKEELRWGARVTLRTADKLAGEKAQGIKFETLWKLKEYFGVASLDELFEEVPGPNGKKARVRRKSG